VKQTVGDDFKFLNFKLLNVLNVIISVLILQYYVKYITISHDEKERKTKNEIVTTAPQKIKK